LKVFFVHAVGLALTVLGIVRSGERPPVLVYQFILAYALRLVTIRVMQQALARNNAALTASVTSLTTTPARGEFSSPLRDEVSHRLVGFPTYLVMLLFFGALAFVLTNVNARHELDVDGPAVIRDVGWAGVLAAMYLVEGLMSRTIVIDPAASIETNLGYNNRDLTLLGLAMLGAGAVVVVRQTTGRTSSGWVVLGPLLLFRFLFDLKG
jgi:hypothetical protein